MQPERKKRSERGSKLIPAGKPFQHQAFPRSTFPVAHAGSERDPSPKAKESVGVGWRGLKRRRTLAGSAGWVARRARLRSDLGKSPKGALSSLLIFLCKDFKIINS